MKISILGAAILAAITFSSAASAQENDADKGHLSITLGDLKQVISQIETRENRLNDDITVSIKNQRLRLFTDNRLYAPGALSFDAYRIGADAQDVFDHSARITLSELKGQLNKARQAKSGNIEISGQNGLVAITPTEEQPDGANTGKFIVKWVDLNELVSGLLVDDSQPIEINLDGVANNDLSFAVPSANPAVATVYLVNYRENKTK